MTLKIPVPGGYDGQSVKVYYSHDGASWTAHENATAEVSLIGGKPYVTVPSTHATMFAIGTSTGSFVINNNI